MTAKRNLVALSATICFVLLLCGPALAWSNGPSGGDSFGTHDWVAHEANRLAAEQGYGWMNASWAQAASDDPDTVLHDTYYHVYDVWGTTYGAAPSKVASLYALAVKQLHDGYPGAASKTVGLLSHYYSDIANPLHTDQTTAEEGMHSPYETDVQVFTDALGENRAWVTYDGFQKVWDPAYKTKATATKAHADYASLVSQYNAYGFNTITPEAITRRAMNLAVNGLVDLIISIKKDATSSVAPLAGGTGLKVAKVSASVSDSTPQRYTNVTVNAGVTDSLRRAVPNAKVTFTWHYKTTTPVETGTTDESGRASYTRYISGASAGYCMVVNVSASGGGGSASTSTSIPPSARLRAALDRMGPRWSILRTSRK